MRTRLTLSLALVLCLLSSSSPAFAEPPPPLGQPITQPFTVRVPSDNAQTITLEPDMALEYAAHNIVEQLFAGLVDIDDATNLVQPDLAESWTLSPDNTVYTFTLQSSLTWSDGEALTADDAAFALLRALDPARDAPRAYVLYDIRNARDYHEGTIADPLQVGVEALDGTHLRITLEAPAAHFPAILAHWTARPVPQHVVEANGDDWATLEHIVSSGAYVLSEWVQDDHLTLNKNTRYYDAANVQIEVIEAQRLSEADAWQAFVNGQLDTAILPPGTVVDPTLQVMRTTQPRPTTYHYGFNVSRPPFDNHWVRKAFCAAVDRQGLVRDVVRGAAQPALTFVPPGVFGHVDGFSEGIGIPFDPTQARQWLSDAGFPNGQGLPPITVWYNTGPGHQAIAGYLRQNWIDHLGVTVTLQSLPWGFQPGQYVAFVRAGEAQAFRYAWTADYNDAYSYLGGALEERTPYGGWTSPEYESLLTRASSETDPQARRVLLKQAEEIIVEADAILLPLHFFAEETAARPYLARTYPGFEAPDVSEWRLLTMRTFLPVVLKN